MSREDDAIVREPRQGDSYWVLGDRYTFKITGDDSGGRFMMLEAEIHPGEGPPPHRHTFETETFFVLEGTLQLLVDDETHVLGPGATASIPEGVLHTFQNEADRPIRTLILTTPAGIEEFFVRIGTPVTEAADGPPAITEEAVAKVQELAPEYGVEIEAPG